MGMTNSLVGVVDGDHNEAEKKIVAVTRNNIPFCCDQSPSSTALFICSI